MKHLIIIGAGGMGRQLYQCAKNCIGYKDEYDIKGFLDDNTNALDEFDGFPPILGTIEDYHIQDEDVFINSIGDIKYKKHCVEVIQDKGGKFINLIHPLASLPENLKIGIGNVILSRVSIGVETEIGDFNLIQTGAIIGHDVKIGSWSRIDCYVVLVAGVNVEDEVCVHTSSVINHNVRLCKGSTVGALSFVIKNVKPGVTVFGSPAIRIKE